MNYEIVNLEEKNVIGFCKRTSNLDPQMQIIIGGLWKNLFELGYVEKINSKCSTYPICLYSDYESDASGKYDATVGFEVSSDAIPPTGTIRKIIPAGTYAKFYIKGNLVDAVNHFWQALWKMDLPRTYTGDFEVYLSDALADEAELYVYIAIDASRI